MEKLNFLTKIFLELHFLLGVGRTFQKLKPFADQTLLENVMIGTFVKEKDIKRAKMFY